MIRRTNIEICLLMALALFAGCLPRPDTPLGPGSPDDVAGCCAPFPALPWESVHMIEAVLGGGATSTLIGATRGYPSERRLHSLLLAPEGFILFEAELIQGRTSVIKAVAPFDSPAFASGLMEDVTLVFLAPEAMATGWDRMPDGGLTCRWEGPDRSGQEVSGFQGREWKILRWDRNREITREVFFRGPFVHGLASSIELRAFKPAPYRLRMTLIRSSLSALSLPRGHFTERPPILTVS